jgi:putative ABC transport system permease protein
VVAFATQSAGLALQSGSSALGPPGVRQWYVSSPSPLGWPQVLGFNHEGWSVISRFLIEHPHLSSGVAPAQSPYSATTHSLGVTRTLHPGSALLVAMLVLEVILVCGPAFAIGARRRRHELAVIGAAGARPRDLAAIVASDGLVLGVAAAVVGAAAGIATGAAALAGLRAWTDRVPGPLTVRWSDVVGIGLLAVVSGLVGAIIPAVATSRAPLSQVLRGRQAPARLSPRWAVVGAATLSLAIAMVAATLGERSSGGIPVPLVGAVVLAELGIALLTPALLAGAGRLAGRLPLWARMTVRDSSRNRSAAAPAVAAVMAVAAACSTALVYGSSQVVHDRLTYTGSLPTGDGVVWLSSANNGHPADPATVLADVRSALPQAAVSELLTSDGQRHVVVVHPLAAGCTPPQLQVGNGGFSSATGTGCGVPTQPSSGPDYLVDDGAFLSSLLGGQEGGEAADALRSGKAVVFDPTLVGAGRVSLAIGPGSPASADLPAFVAPWPYGASTAPASIVLPPGVAGRLHLSYAPGEIYIRHAAAQPRSGIRAADAALAGMGMQGIFVQAAYSNRIDSLLLGIVGADLLLAFAVAVAATALLVLESKPDLQVLAAVGAPPGGRRRLSVTRAGFICGLGSILGAGMGTVAGAALVWRVRHLESGPGNSLTGTYPLSLPWLHLLAVLVVPTAVAAAAALLIRGPRLDTELRRVG